MVLKMTVKELTKLCIDKITMFVVNNPDDISNLEYTVIFQGYKEDIPEELLETKLHGFFAIGRNELAITVTF